MVDGRCQTITALENERVCSFSREVGDGGGDPGWQTGTTLENKHTCSFSSGEGNRSLENETVC